MLSFSLVAEALTGLIYYRPSGENFSFVCFVNYGLNGSIVLSSKVKPGKEKHSFQEISLLLVLK